LLVAPECLAEPVTEVGTVNDDSLYTA